MLQDLGVTVEVVLLADSSAGKGIVNRRGLGKVRHIGVNAPGSICERKMAVHKVRGEDNFADSFTKDAGVERISRTMTQCHDTVQSHSNCRKARHNAFGRCRQRCGLFAQRYLAISLVRC